MIQAEVEEPKNLDEKQFNEFARAQLKKENLSAPETVQMMLKQNLNIMKHSPYLLYSDGKGNIFEDTSLYVCGRSGWDALPVENEEWITLPEGGQLYELPHRHGIGIDVKTGEMRLCEKGWAVAAFIPPAFTGTYLAAYETLPDAETLPLFCYTAAGWYDEKFYVTAVRIEKDIRQESAGFDEEKIESGVANLLSAYKHNRLVEHLANNCCLTYHCPAARNFFIGRWECPVPTSPACNANCIGCISFQPQEENIVSTQDRLTFKPNCGRNCRIYSSPPGNSSLSYRKFWTRL